MSEHAGIYLYDPSCQGEECDTFNSTKKCTLHSQTSAATALENKPTGSKRISYEYGNTADCEDDQEIIIRYVQ